MKKIVTFLLLVSFFGSVYAQDGKLSIGIKGGLNLASISNTGGSSSAAAFGYGSSYKRKIKFLPHIGAYSEYKINDFFSIQPELLFSMKGYGSKSSASSAGYVSEYEQDIILSYIDIPVQARFNFGKGFHMLVGPYIGFLVAATQKEKEFEQFGSTIYESEYKVSSTAGLSSPDVGMYLGAGYEMESGLNFGVRWCRAFTDLTNYGGYYYVYDVTNSNSVWQFSVGYKLASF